VAIQGKPQVRFAPAAGSANEVIQVRAKSPVREFVLADGTAPAASRRQLVVIEKCNACHLGSMYQHGGNRIDSIELCVMCHNPASNEKNNRVGFGVDASEAYDRQPGETYDLRYMIHAIHSAGETNAPLVYYRSIGVYLFGSKAARDAAPSWPGEGCFVMNGTTSTAVSRDCGGSPPGSNLHNFVEVHYPRKLNDCAACHADGWVPGTPDPTQGVAVTVDAGAAPWGGQVDDVLLGASAASCMCCHQSGDPAVQVGLKVHAYGNGWIPTTFENGRQTVLDAAARPLP
jgi:OmcA/MtrC family decaheme c-type cytochrome